MQKRIVAIALCLVMISSFAITSAVSAAQAGKSNVRHYDLTADMGAANSEWIKYGTLTVKVLDDGTGTFVLTVNAQKLDKSTKDAWKGQSGTTWSIWGINRFGSGTLLADHVVVVNNGGTQHGTGTLSADAVEWLKQWGDYPDSHISTSNVWLPF